MVHATNISRKSIGVLENDRTHHVQADDDQQHLCAKLAAIKDIMRTTLTRIAVQRATRNTVARSLIMLHCETSRIAIDRSFYAKSVPGSFFQQWTSWFTDSSADFNYKKISPAGKGP